MKKLTALAVALAFAGISPVQQTQSGSSQGQYSTSGPKHYSGANKIGFETRLNACLCSKLSVFLEKVSGIYFYINSHAYPSHRSWKYGQEIPFKA